MVWQSIADLGIGRAAKMTMGIRTAIALLTEGERTVIHLCGLDGSSNAQHHAVRGLLKGARQYDAGAELLTGVSRPSASYVVSGWGCWRLDLADGRRQIFGFVMPGDRLGDATLTVGSVVALTPMSTVESGALGALAPGFSPLRDRSARSGFAVDHDMLLDQIVRLGQLSAYERVAHLLLEIRRRLASAGLNDGLNLPFPLTQETLSNALGLSPVHLNRTLQRMRKEGLIELRSSRLTLLKPHLLAAICDYQHDEMETAEPIRETRNTGLRAPFSHYSPMGISA